MLKDVHEAYIYSVHMYPCIVLPRALLLCKYVLKTIASPLIKPTERAAIYCH